MTSLATHEILLIRPAPWSRKTQAEINRTREGFKPIAFRVSSLFFCIADLGSVDPMYAWSMPWYVALFERAIDEAKKTLTLVDELAFPFNRLPIGRRNRDLLATLDHGHSESGLRQQDGGLQADGASTDHQDVGRSHCGAEVPTTRAKRQGCAPRRGSARRVPPPRT